MGLPDSFLRSIFPCVIQTSNHDDFSENEWKVFFLLQEVDSCFGDSGGPASIASANGQHTLVKKRVKRMHLQIYQVGVVSYGLGCANPRWPALYTRVTKVCQHFNYGIINKKYFFYYINDGFPRAALRLKKRENFRNLGLILPFFLPFCVNLT